MKKFLLMLMLPLMLCAGCTAQVAPTTEEASVPSETKGGSEAETEAEADTEKEQRLFNDYEYVYVYSQMFGEKYYHVSTLKEYFFAEGIGLELELFTSKKHIYYFEQNLRYVLFTEYDSNLGRVIE